MKLRLLLLLIVFITASSLRAQDTSVPSGRFKPISLDNAYQTAEQNVLDFGLLYDVTWSPNGKNIAVASSTGLLLYDAERLDTAPQRRLSLSDDTVSLVAFSPDGKLLAALSQMGNSELQPGINLWDLATQQIVANLPIQSSGSALVFSPDGSVLAFDQGDQASLWNVRQLPAVHRLADQRWLDVQRDWYLLHSARFVPQNERDILAYSSTGTLLAIPNAAGTVDILDVLTGSRETTAMSVSAGSPQFSPNGKLLFWTVSTGANTELHIWDVDLNQEAFSGTHLLVAYAFHPFLSQMLFATGDGNLWLWDARTRLQRIILGYEQQSTDHAVLSVAFSPNRPLVAVARVNRIELWNTALGVKQAVIAANDSDQQPINRIAFSPDGSLIASAGDDDFARVWNAYTLQQVASIQHDSAVRDVAFSPDGRYLATYSRVVDTDSNLGSSAVFLWRISTIVPSTEPIAAKDAAARIYHTYYPSYDNNSYRVRFSPDGTIIALTGNGIEFWDVAKVLDHGLNADSRSELSTAWVGSFQNGIGPLAYSPDGQWLATGVNAASSDQNCGFVVLKIGTGDAPICMTGNDGIVTDLAFSPSGDVLASSSSGSANGTSDNTVRLWNPVTGEQLSAFNPDAEDVWSVAFSLDGTLLASGSGCALCSSDNYSRDGVVRLWGIPRQP